ncbi:MAG: prepilin-type N-terminal cleavage/methylation domain-containing protein [Lacipirellulaceae bacterium]
MIPSPRGKQRSAFTLLEVVLALAILGLALATLGAAVRLSHENALRAAREAEALGIAQSVLAELESGARPLTSAENVPWQSSPDQPNPAELDRWVTSVTPGSGPLQGLVVVRVGVTLEAGSVPPLVRVEVAKWMPDPSVASEADAASTAGASSSTAGFSGPGTGS